MQSPTVVECDSVVVLVSGYSDGDGGGICGGGDVGDIGGDISGRGGGICGKGDVIDDWGVVTSSGSAILEAGTDGVLLRLEVDYVGGRLVLESRSVRVLGDIPDDLLHFTGRPLAFLIHFSL